MNMPSGMFADAVLHNILVPVLGCRYSNMIRNQYNGNKDCLTWRQRGGHRDRENHGWVMEGGRKTTYPRSMRCSPAEAPCLASSTLPSWPSSSPRPRSPRTSPGLAGFSCRVRSFCRSWGSRRPRSIAPRARSIKRHPLSLRLWR